MNTTLRLASLLLVLPLAACHRDDAPASATPDGTAAMGAPTTIIGKSVDVALRKARRELETSNIDISNGGGDINIDTGRHRYHISRRASDAPKAEITPQGDLLVGGKPVAVTAAQRDLLLQYRRHIIDVAAAGMAVGVQGADLAGKALSESLGGLLGGDTDGFERRMEAEGKRLEVEARRICAQLPPMLSTQEQLAASLPAFRPYATMTREDIDDCLKDGGDVADAGGRQRVREGIRTGVREGTRAAVEARSPTGDSSTTDASAATR